MKKIYFLLALFTVIGLSFSSCKKDGEEKPTTFSIVSNWKTTNVNREYFFKEQSTGVKYNMEASDYVDHILFNSDGTGDMSVNGLVIRKFNYTSTSADIHFANVTSFNGKTWVSSPNFMFYINTLTNNELTFTQQDFYFNHPVESSKEYDKIIISVKLIKQ